MLLQRLTSKRIETACRHIRGNLFVPHISIERDKPLAKGRRIIWSERRDLLFDGFNFTHGLRFYRKQNLWRNA